MRSVVRNLAICWLVVWRMEKPMENPWNGDNLRISKWIWWKTGGKPMDFWKMPGWYFDVNDAAGDQSYLCQGEKFETGFKIVFRSNKGCLSVFVHVIIFLSVFWHFQFSLLAAWLLWGQCRGICSVRRTLQPLNEIDKISKKSWVAEFMGKMDAMMQWCIAKLDMCCW